MVWPVPDKEGYMKMITGVKWNRFSLTVITAVTLGLSLACGFATQAEAAVQAEEAVYQAVDGHQISAERLQDNTIEYAELGSLIHANNITVQDLVTSSDNQKQTYAEAVDYLESEKASANRNKKEAEDSGDTESYSEYASWETIYRSSIKSYNNMIERLDKYSANKSRIQVERELTKTAQSLMASYESVALQTEYLAKMEQLSAKQYEVAVSQKQVGLATDLEVQDAYSQWLSTQVSVSSLTDTEDSLYRSLCLLLGVDETGGVNVQKIPATNLNRVVELDLEADMEIAVNNNYDVIEARSTASGSTSAGNTKARTTEELETNVKLMMKQLYEAVLQTKKSYEAAQTGYSSAQIAWNNAQNKYRLGMLSEAEYIQAEMQYTQKKAALESAGLELQQALDTYDWAVLGIMELT